MLSHRRDIPEAITLRLDKYLKSITGIKRRQLLKKWLIKGVIKVNGVLLKSSTDLKIGDDGSFVWK